MNLLPSFFFINITPDMLRLLIIPIFIFASLLDYKKRIVYNQLWMPAIGLVIITLSWDFLILLSQSNAARTEYFQSLSISVILGSSIAQMLYNSGTIGGADMKSIVYLSFLFPQPPSITAFGITFPYTPGTTPIFSFTILLNAIIISLSVRVYILYRNVNDSNTETLNTKMYRITTDIVSDKHGYFQYGNNEEIEIEKIRDKITTDKNTDSSTKKQTTLTPTKTNNKLINEFLHQLTHLRKHITLSKLDTGPLTHTTTKKETEQTNKITDDQRKAIAYLQENDFVLYSPAIPFFIPLTLGLIIALTHGSILYTTIESIILLLI